MVDQAMNLKVTWETFYQNWDCLRKCLEQLGGVWQSESIEDIVAALQKMKGLPQISLDDCTAEAPRQKASLMTCRTWEEEILEALVELEAEAQEDFAIQQAKRFAEQLSTINDYLDALDDVWPVADEMMSLLKESRPVLAQMEAEEKVEGEVAETFSLLLMQAAKVQAALGGKLDVETQLQAWNWDVKALSGIDRWRAEAWQVARVGLRDAATRALGMRWIEAWREIVVIRQALRRYQEISGQEEAQGETIGDIHRVLAEAIDTLHLNFEAWIGRETAHVANLLPELPPEALARLREVLGKAQGVCQKVEVPLQKDGDVVCETVAQVWEVLKTSRGDKSIPEEWQRRYERLEEAEQQLSAVAARWEAVKTQLEEVEGLLKRRQWGRYKKALEVLGKLREEYPGHAKYRDVIKRWLEGAAGWARQLANEKGKVIAPIVQALEGWEENEAEAKIDALLQEWGQWQAGVKQLEEDLWPVLPSGDIEEAYDEIAEQLQREWDVEKVWRQGIRALERTKKSFTEGKKALGHWKKQVQTVKQRRQDALRQIKQWQETLKEGEGALRRVTREVEEWLGEDAKQRPPAQVLPEVQDFLRWLNEQKGPQEHWESALRAYEQKRYLEAWHAIESIEHIDTSGEFRKKQGEIFEHKRAKILLAASWQQAEAAQTIENYALAYRIMQDAWGKIPRAVRDVFRSSCKSENVGNDWRLTCDILSSWRVLEVDYAQREEKDKTLQAVWSARGWDKPVALPLVNEEKVKDLTAWFENLPSVREQARFLEVTAGYIADGTTPGLWRKWYRQVWEERDEKKTTKKWGEALLEYYRSEAETAIKGHGWATAVNVWERASAALPSSLEVKRNLDEARWYAAMAACAEEWEEKDKEDWRATLERASEWSRTCRQDLEKKAKQEGWQTVSGKEQKAAFDLLRQWENIFREGREKGIPVIWEQWKERCQQIRIDWKEKQETLWDYWKEKQVPLYHLWQTWWREWSERWLQQSEKESDGATALEMVMGAYLAATHAEEKESVSYLVNNARKRLETLVEASKVDWVQRARQCRATLLHAQEMDITQAAARLGQIYCEWEQCLREAKRLQNYAGLIKRAAGEVNKPVELLRFNDILPDQIKPAVQLLADYRLGEVLKKRKWVCKEVGEIVLRGGGGLAGVALSIIGKWCEQRKAWRAELQQGLERLARNVYFKEKHEQEQNIYLEGLQLLWGDQQNRGLAHRVEEIADTLRAELSAENTACEGLLSEEERFTPKMLEWQTLFSHLGVEDKFPVGWKAHQWKDLLQDMKDKADNAAYFQTVLRCLEKQQKALRVLRNDFVEMKGSGKCSRKLLTWTKEQFVRLQQWYAPKWDDIRAIVLWSPSSFQERVGEGECLTERLAMMSSEEVLDWQEEARKSSLAEPLTPLARRWKGEAEKVLQDIQKTLANREDEKALIRWCEKEVWTPWEKAMEKVLRGIALPPVHWERRSQQSVVAWWEGVMEKIEAVVRFAVQQVQQRAEMDLLRSAAELLAQYDAEEPFLQWLCALTRCQHAVQSAEEVDERRDRKEETAEHQSEADTEGWYGEER